MNSDLWYNIEDIVYQVFELLRVDVVYTSVRPEDATLCRQALARSARSCKAFASPALTILWRSLPSDQPLLELLYILGIVESSSDYAPTAYNTGIGLSDTPINLPVLSVQENVRAHPQWQHFLRHASHVRQIRLDPFRSSAGSAIWPEIAFSMDGIPILPRLTSVYVTSIFSPLRGRVLSCHNLGCLALIHPSIRGLRLRLSRKGKVDEALHRIMSHIVTTVKSLEYFRSVYSPAHLGNPGLLTHFTRIRHVTIDGDIHPSDLRDVAKLSGLRRLSIPLYTSLSSERLVSSSITDLHVEDPWNVLGGFLERAHVPQLRSLHIITESSAKSPLGADASQLLHIVAAAFTTLEILSIEWKDDCARRVDAPIRAPYSAGRLADITEPLLPLRALREVSLEFRGYDLEYTSRDVQALSEAWPSLEELRLNFRTAIGPRSGIESLTHLAHNCPHLRILDLPGMDAADDALAAAWTPAASHPNLYGLVIERVVFQGMDEAKMWQFIARQFPKAARRATVGPKNY